MMLRRMAAGLVACCLIALVGSVSNAAADPPLLSEHYDWINENDYDRFGDWVWFEGGPNDYFHEAVTNEPNPEYCPAGNCGLIVGATPGGTYSVGDTGGYVWQVPGGESAYIDSVEADAWAYYRTDPLANDDPSSFFGTISGDPAYLDDSIQIKDNDSGSESFTGGPDTHAFAFGMQTTSSPFLTDPRAAYLGDVTINYGDGEAPSLDGFDVPSPAWLPELELDIPVHAEDAGLGVQAVTLEAEKENPAGPGDKYESEWDGECAGTRSSPCETETPNDAVVHLDPSELPEGQNTLLLQARDPLGKVSDEEELVLDFDKTKPTFDLSGSFTTAPSMVLTGASYDLKVEAKDGTPLNPNAGVQVVHVYVDNQSVDFKDEQCLVSNCELELDVEIEPDDYTNGPHKLRVEVYDQVGHERIQEIDFEVDR